MQLKQTNYKLGITVDNHLSWNDQIDKVSGTLSNRIALLRRIKDYLPTERRITCYNIFQKQHKALLYYLLRPV